MCEAALIADNPWLRLRGLLGMHPVLLDDRLILSAGLSGGLLSGLQLGERLR